MNVLFIEKNNRTDRLGIMYLSAVLRQAGHEVYMIQDDLEPAIEYMSKNKVDVVCWSMLSPESDWMMNKNTELKKHFNFISIIGGMHPTYFPEEGEKDPNVNFVVIGPGENVINKILSGEITSKVVKGSIPDVNVLPPPYREVQYRYDEYGKSRVKRFMAGRYCYHSCVYCFNNKFKSLFKDQIKKLGNRRTVDNVINEIKDVKKRFGLEHALFNDDDIACNKNWIIEFCDKMQDLKLEWSALIVASSVDKNILERMAKSGCLLLNMGIESAVLDTQSFLNRQFVNNKDVENAVRWCKEVGIKPRLLSMIGLPVDDPLKDAMETLKFNLQVKPDDSFISIFQPFKGTTLWDYCIEKGLIDGTRNGGVFLKGFLNIKDREKINRLGFWWPHIIKYNMDIHFVEMILEIPISDDLVKKFHDYRLSLSRKETFKM